MDEFDIIRQFFVRQPQSPGVLVGIGDDGAVMQVAPGSDLVTVIDTLVEGVHFPSFLDAGDVGYRAVAVNLSDMAAMGAVPKWMTLALTLREANSAWLKDFATGLFAAADEHGVALVGGDTTHGSEIVVTVQVSGQVDPGQAMLRSGACAGDSIYITGTMGDAAAGLSVLQSGAPQNKDTEFLVHRFARPTARLHMANAISQFAHSAIDLSDGLFTDLEKLLDASGVSGRIEMQQIPLSEPLRRTMQQDDALRFALSGGDDYELCFTTAAPDAAVQKMTAGLDVRATCIGNVAAGSGLVCTLGGLPTEYRDTGYRHFND